MSNRTRSGLGAGITPEQRRRDLVEEAEVGDQLGLDVLAVGERHRPDRRVSSPAVVRAAIELSGANVAPLLREELARRDPRPSPAAAQLA